MTMASGIARASSGTRERTTRAASEASQPFRGVSAELKFRPTACRRDDEAIRSSFGDDRQVPRLQRQCLSLAHGGIGQQVGTIAVRIRDRLRRVRKVQVVVSRCLRLSRANRRLGGQETNSPVDGSAGVASCNRRLQPAVVRCSARLTRQQCDRVFDAENTGGPVTASGRLPSGTAIAPPHAVLWILLALFVSAAAAAAIHGAAPRAAGWLLALLPASIAVYLLATAGSAGVRAERYAWVPLLDVELSFYADGLSRLFAVLVTGIGAIVIVYAGAYLKDDRKYVP
jgi:hypothetical protein